MKIISWCLQLISSSVDSYVYICTDSFTSHETINTGHSKIVSFLYGDHKNREVLYNIQKL